MNNSHLETVTIDGKKLKETFDVNPTAHSIIEMLANRERFRRFIDIDKTKSDLVGHGISVDADDYFNFFQKLQENGYGAIIYGRGGRSDRFEWFYNLKSIGKAALNGTEEVSEVIDEISKQKGRKFNREAVKKLRHNFTPPVTRQVVPNVAGRKVSIHDTALIYIPLRSDLTIDLELPRNLTALEINTIKSALDRLSK